MYWYKYRSNHVSWYIDVLWLNCFNEIIVHCGQPKWYRMLLKEKTINFSLKQHRTIYLVSNNISLYRDTSEAIYQYVSVLTHCMYRCNSRSHHILSIICKEPLFFLEIIWTSPNVARDITSKVKLTMHYKWI